MKHQPRTLVLTLMAFFGVFIFVAQAASAQQVVGSVVALQGKVEVRTAEGKTLPLVLKAPVRLHDVIQTDSTGKVQIIFHDDSLFTISANSELVIDDFVYKPATGEGRSVVSAPKGVFKFVTGKIAKNDRKNVAVKTPFATIGVRGSGGVVQVDAAGVTRVGLTQCCLQVHSQRLDVGGVPLTALGTFVTVNNPQTAPAAPQPYTPDFQQMVQENFGGESAFDTQANENEREMMQVQAAALSSETGEAPSAGARSAAEEGIALQEASQQKLVEDVANQDHSPAAPPQIDTARAMQGIGTNRNSAGAVTGQSTYSVDGGFGGDRLIATVRDGATVVKEIVVDLGAVPGFNALNNVTIGGSAYHVSSFRTMNNDFFTVDFRPVTLAGNAISLYGGVERATVPNSGASFYTITSQLDGTGVKDQGTVAADWQRNLFAGGGLNTAVDANGNTVITGMNVSMGQVNGNTLTGQHSSLSHGADGIVWQDGSTQSQALYGENSVAGIIMQQNTQQGLGLNGGTAQQGMQALAQNMGNPQLQADMEQTQLSGGGVKSYTGFMAGNMATRDANGNIVYQTVKNDVYEGQVDRGVNITVDTTSANNGVKASLSGTMDTGTSADSVVTAKFGYATGSGVALTDTAYAAQYTNSAFTSGEGVLGSNGNNGLVTVQGGTLGAPGSAQGMFDAAGFGSAVSMDNQWLIVGASETASGPLQAGAAYIYKRDDMGAWQLFQELTAPASGDLAAAFGDKLGERVALYGDFAFVAAPNADVMNGTGAGEGTVYVYHFNGSQWQFSQALEGAAAQAALGQSLHASGGYLVAGSATAGSGNGDVNIYALNSNNQWQLRDSIAGSGGLFGKDAVVSDDGQYVAIAAPDAAGKGQVTIYKWAGSTYVEHTVLRGLATGDNFGSALALNNGKIVVGASGYDGGATNAGGAFIYDLDGNLLLTIAGTGAGYGVGESVAFNGDYVILGNGSYDGGNGVQQVALLRNNGTAYQILDTQTGANGSGNAVALQNMQVNANGQGMLVSDFISENRCIDCDYVHWGIWAGQFENEGVAGQDNLAIADMIYYVAGEMTTAAQLGALTASNVNFSGMTAGSLATGGNVTHHIGDFNANVDFANRNVNFTNINLGNYGMTGNAAWNSGQQAFTGTLNGAGITSGNVNGAFFGPAAENIGGNFDFTAGATKGAGVYLGKQD